MKQYVARPGRLMVFLGLCALNIGSPGAPGDDSEPAQSGTWISVNGGVDEIIDERFILDHGDGRLEVRMDDANGGAGTTMLVEGDHVIVNGKLEEGFFQDGIIDAGSVYVAGIDAVFPANPVSRHETLREIHAGRESNVYLEGTVTGREGGNLILDTGVQRMIIRIADRTRLTPLEAGRREIQEGDRVSVSGRLDIGINQNIDIIADSIVRLGRRPGLPTGTE